MLYCAFCDFVTTESAFQAKMGESDLLMNHATEQHLQEALAAEKVADATRTTEDGHWNTMIRHLGRNGRTRLQLGGFDGQH